MTTTHLLVIFFTALVAAMVFTPFAIKLAHHLQIVDHPAHRKIHKKPVAYLGGPALFAALLAGLGVAVVISRATEPLTISQWFKLGCIMIPTLGAVALGLWDDRFGMRARYKFLGQAVLVLLFSYFGYRFEVLHIPGFPQQTLGLLAVPLTAFWMLALINAFNMIDGVDGLASSVAAIALFFTAMVAAMVDNRLQMVLALAGLGAVLGFLMFNWKPGRIFLGDAGSNGLGMFLTAGAVAMGQGWPQFMNEDVFGPPRQPFHYQFFIATLLLSYPAVEVTLSVVRRALRGTPITRSDKGHLHHRMLKRGLNVQTICGFAALFMVLTGGAVVSFMADERGRATWLLFALGILMGLGAATLGFLNFLSPRKLALHRPHFLIAHHFISMQQVKLQLAASLDELKGLITQTCMEFGVGDYRLIVLPDHDLSGGCDLKWKEEKGEQGHLFRFFMHEPAPNAAPFKDKVMLSRHRGEAGWSFRPHPHEEDLDVEYRVLISEFMKAALEKAQELSRRSEVSGPVEKEPSGGSAHVVSIDDLRRRSGTM